MAKISLGSLFELETQITISEKLNFLKQAEYEKLFEKIKNIRMMICSFVNKLAVSRKPLAES
jgi:four helix bundle protein